MSSKYFATVYDIVKPIATFLHPIRVEGLENVPKEGPVLLCPNHSSNWDPILLICALGREANLQIMGKNQLFKIPVLRTFLRGRTNHIFGVIRINTCFVSGFQGFFDQFVLPGMEGKNCHTSAWTGATPTSAR